MRIHVVTAFTDRPFAGNPAGVCLLPAGPWPQDAWMQRVAAEMNHSETAFALPLPASDEADWAIRWFAPLVETNLCGHATLATAHVLRTEHGVLGAVRFASRQSGVLVTHADASGGITLDFPAAPGTEVPVPDGLVGVLGTEPEATYRTGALGDLLTVLPDEATVRAVTPDLATMAELTRRERLRGVIITAPPAGAHAADGAAGAVGEPSGNGEFGENGQDRPPCDFVSRFFSPAEGIREDPATGSAHTALAPYWSARLGRQRLTGFQVSARTGVIHTALHGDRVHLTGNAVTVLDGTLHV
ncbi:PhzF family phenazine biosynthesis protein [Streptomyces sp. AC563]|uniref:PhzF family phenazine biosynthesis protein n=1 Tax=Streptomyces buecherae TaxID=2763006 RepID=UPI00164E5904|nr:PhzF family phenazine biosynthesis protein [Streptomyces buecherae]MBC3991325.1 PhzF family phenazine biosynthesis protein [Streptomyces buecherae]